MANVPAAPILLTDVTVKIGPDTFEEACRTVTLTPTTPTVKWKGLSPASRHAFAGTPEWDAALTFAVDIASAASLTKTLHNGVGTVVEFQFEPVKDGPTVTVDIVLVPGALGGSIDAVPEATVTMPCVGQPVIAPAA